MIVLPNEGLADQLAYILQATISGVADWELMLFQNDLTPDQDTVYSSMVEATFSGYSRVTLNRGNWTNPTIIADQAVSTYTTTPQIWLVGSGPQTIYGYALIDPDAEVIRVIERFGTPPTVDSGGVIAVLPKYQFTTMPP